MKKHKTLMKNQECITLLETYKQTFPKSLPNTFPTFPKIWTGVMLSKLWDIHYS